MPTGFQDTDWEPRNIMVYDTFHEALAACVQACGGMKAVAAMLWPTKDAFSARDQLLACLNPSRNKEKLSLDELLFVMKTARQRGCHAGMEYLADRLSYAPPSPIKPEDEADELQRSYIKAAAQMQKVADRIFELERTDSPRLSALRRA